LITRRKCRARHDYLRADRRDIGRESERDECLTVDSQPTPAEAAMLAETLSTWLAGLDPPSRAILEHGLQGFQTAEIAIRLGRSERSVRRVRERAEATLRTMLEAG
jgi:RNA polymerase sigma factor (sigma-70 family)